MRSGPRDFRRTLARQGTLDILSIHQQNWIVSLPLIALLKCPGKRSTVQPASCWVRGSRCGRMSCGVSRFLRGRICKMGNWIHLDGFSLFTWSTQGIIDRSYEKLEFALGVCRSKWNEEPRASVGITSSPDANEAAPLVSQSCTEKRLSFCSSASASTSIQCHLHRKLWLDKASELFLAASTRTKCIWS